MVRGEYGVSYSSILRDMQYIVSQATFIALAMLGTDSDADN